MSELRVVPKDRCTEIIDKLIRNEAHAVVSCHGPAGWRTYKSHFMSGSRVAEVVRVRTRRSPDAQGLRLPAVRETVGVTFRLSHKKCMFTSVVLSTAQDEDGAVLTLCWPDKLHQLQRRAYERAAPPRGCVIPVRFWREEASSQGQGERRNVRHGQLEDISAGGMRIKTAESADIEIGGTYRCVFAPRPGAAALMLEATLKHSEAADCGRASLGFHFVGLETTTEGQSLLDRLARLVNQFQRARARSRR